MMLIRMSQSLPVSILDMHSTMSENYANLSALAVDYLSLQFDFNRRLS